MFRVAISSAMLENTYMATHCSSNHWIKLTWIADTNLRVKDSGK